MMMSLMISSLPQVGLLPMLFEVIILMHMMLVKLTLLVPIKSIGKNVMSKKYLFFKQV